MPMIGPTVDHTEIRKWADRDRIVPVEVMPHIVDHEPAGLELVVARSVKGRPEVRVISWEEFFARFDVLQLSVVYDDDSSGYNELLQHDEKAPGISRSYQLERLKH